MDSWAHHGVNGQMSRLNDTLRWEEIPSWSFCLAISDFVVHHREFRSANLIVVGLGIKLSAPDPLRSSQADRRLRCTLAEPKRTKCSS